MSKNTKIIIGWVVSIIIAVIGAFWGGSKTVNNQSQSVIVNVNGQEISIDAQELQDKYNSLKSEYDQALHEIELLKTEIESLYAKPSNADNVTTTNNDVPENNNQQNNKTFYLGEDEKAYDKRGNYFEYPDNGYITIADVKYYSGIANPHDNTSHGLYNLASQYNQLSGLYGPIDGSRACGTINFYGDGKILQSYDIEYGSMPKEFSVNIQNISQLKVEFVDNGFQGGIAIVNVLLQ